VSVASSLATDELVVLWNVVRDRLEHNGADWRGRVALPPLSADGRLAVESLTGRRPRSQIGLADIESGLRRLGVGEDLPGALGALGFPLTGEVQARRATRAASRAARDEVRSLTRDWPEAWAPEWADAIIRRGVLSGFDVNAASRLVESVRQVLDALAGASHQTRSVLREHHPGGALAGQNELSRVELAARILGDAHALDTGTRLERATTAALGFATENDDGRGVWERAGAHSDLVSGATLTWNLPLAASHPLAAAAATATDCGVPFVLTQLALRLHPVIVDPDPILVVENPRVLEYAAQQRSPVAVICANGNPSSTTQLLLRQLVESPADVRYHGDFDAAGLAMCGRMQVMGLVPWRMDATDYLAALDDADAAGVDLPVDLQPIPPTPWDPSLALAFDRERRVVHEERLLDRLFDTQSR